MVDIKIIFGIIMSEYTVVENYMKKPIKDSEINCL